MIVTALKSSLLTILGIATFLPSLSANTIAAGQTAAPDVFSTSASYTLLASTGPQNVNPDPAHGSFNATYTETVWSDSGNIFCSGCLSFFIQLSNAGPGTVERISTGNFDGFLTDVGYRQGSIGVTPTSVNRSADGNVIGFNFIPPGSPIASGQQSAFLEIQTNARAFTAGTVSVQDGSSGFAAGFAPAAVPEPMSMVLLGSGLMCVGFWRKRLGSKA